MVRKYSEEQISYLREIAPGRYTNEITEMFNDHFDTNLTESQIKGLRGNYKIRSGVEKKNPFPTNKLLSDDQAAYLEAIAEGRLSGEVTQMMNRKFGLSLTEAQIRAYKARYKLRSGVQTTFEKGHAPANKGTRGVFNVGGNRTSFKKGSLPVGTKKVGTETLRADGYLWVKIAMPNKWKEKHRIIWEEAHGPIPDDNVIIFKDNNPRNCVLENLMMITRQQHVRLNQNDWRSNDPELIETALLLADISTAKGKRKKSGKTSGGKN